MSASILSGAQKRAAAAMSQRAEPGLERSKSMNAAARPFRNTTLSRLGSLWLTSFPAYGDGGDGGQRYGPESKVATAAWERRSSAATLTSAGSVKAQAG